jgi:alpha-2-macroglobulin
MEVVARGAWRLYVTAKIEYATAASAAPVASHGITVKRSYTIPTPDPFDANLIPSGGSVVVHVDITADSNYRYAVVEEPIPAGCEVDPGDDKFRPLGLEYETANFMDSNAPASWPMQWYVRQEIRDDRVVFLFDELHAGVTHLVYTLHAETPGDYRILPDTASLVYFPEVRAGSQAVRATIVETRDEP